MTISALGDTVIYDDGTGVLPGNRTSASGVVILGPTGPLGTSTNPLVTQTSSLQTTPDLTSLLVTINTATTTQLVAAAASTKCRVYRVTMDCAAANVLTFNAATNRVVTFGGVGHIIYDFATRPWLTTATNTALTVTTATTGLLNIVIEYTRVA